jgi:hypothetical protein
VSGAAAAGSRATGIGQDSKDDGQVQRKSAKRTTR